MPTDKSFIEVIIEIFQQEREASKKSRKTKKIDEKIVNGMREFLESPF